jgi:hypothetical protein
VLAHTHVDPTFTVTFVNTPPSDNRMLVSLVLTPVTVNCMEDGVDAESETVATEGERFPMVRMPKPGADIAASIHPLAVKTAVAPGPASEIQPTLLVM